MKVSKIQLVITFIAAGSIALAFAVSSNDLESLQRKAPPKKQAEYPVVTTVPVSTGTYTALVKGFGSVTPNQSLQLTSEVSGRIVHLSPKLKSGQTFKAGAELLVIDDVEYQEAVASAKSDLATTEVELLQEQLNQKQAQEEWKRSGLKGQPNSDLVFYIPQVKAAQAKVEYARKALEKAKSDLAYTRVKAPFNAQVISRSVETGSYVQTGTELVQLYDTDLVQISVPLSSQQWNNLPNIEAMQGKTEVTLTSADGNKHWTGFVARAEQHLDSTSRQRSLIITVEAPLKLDTPLYPGSFVQASIPGKAVGNLWQIPASSLTQDNKIWYLDANSTLQAAQANIHFSANDYIFVSPIEGLKETNIVIHPLSSYLPGMRAVDRNATKQTTQQQPNRPTSVETDKRDQQ
mgnify:CR=1 FL=1